jgi:outer membrane protein
MIRVRALAVLPDAGAARSTCWTSPRCRRRTLGLRLTIMSCSNSTSATSSRRTSPPNSSWGDQAPHHGHQDARWARHRQSWLQPPTLTLQYHFTKFGAFKAYIGLGVNYTVFFSQSAANTPVAGLAVTQLNITNSFGAAAQVGGLNFEVKKLYLEPNYTAAVNSAIPVSAPRISTRGWSRAASP